MKKQNKGKENKQKHIHVQRWSKWMLLNYRKDSSSTWHILSPNDDYIAKNGLHLIQLLAKAAPWEPQNNSGHFEGYWLLYTNKKASLLATTPIQLTKHREKESSSMVNRDHCIGRYSAPYPPQKKVDTNPAINSSITWWPSWKKH